MEHSNWSKRSACQAGRGYFYVHAKHAHTCSMYKMERQQSFSAWVRQRAPHELNGLVRAYVCVFVSYSLPPSISLSIALHSSSGLCTAFQIILAISCVHLFRSTIHAFIYSDSQKIHLLLIEVQLRKDTQASERKSNVKLYVMFR